uniref:Fibronectin type-III domain-containing protein n=1 Tax=Mesocestoides corti TaxID=53468 RepID=A0A5K3F7L3_MESCO
MLFQWKHNYGFVIGPPLEPGKTYRFRVRAVSPNSGADAIPPSGWSDSVSTHHISNAPPPRITSVQPYHDGRFNVTWEYDGDGKNLKWANESASFEPFVPDFFLILVRPVLKNDAKPGDEGAGKADNVVKFGRYRATQVNGSDAKEGFIYNLNTSVSYQLVVYGVKYENGVRRITRFSEAKFATLPEVPGFGSFSLIRAVTENKPIFIGLGALALIIFIIIMILVVMCVARQRKDRRRRRAKHNGFVAGHSETDKYQSQQTNQRGDDLRPSSPSVKAAQGAAGQAMMMGTLMRQSNFSETDAQRFQQQQHQQQQQQQFAHQQMAMMDPSLHFGYYGQQPQPHHHQSHHSLLLSPTGGMASPMFHSSTLPGGPARYSGSTMRATPHPPPFGSQQVLNQGGGGGGGGGDQSEQAILMRDFYNQQYQQQRLYQQTLQQQVMGQQPFMYATNNPAAYLPPQHPGDTMSRRQSQGYPYGGSTHSGTSLKRDGLPTNGSGSMHEDATLLARSPMSPHVQMLNEPAGSPVSGLPPPGYFQQAGSQQALHMQGVGGAAGYPLSPSQQMSMYQQHQQSLMMAGSPQMGGVPFYPGQPPPPDPALMRHHSMGHHTDGESIYSYFSQQDVCHPQSHAHLNPLPEENHMNLGYTESGSQTAGLNGGGGGGGGTLTGNSVTGSPVGTGASGHRHHRRRRRKQQQQQQTPQQRQLGAGEGAEGMPSDGYQYGDQQQQQYPGYNDHMMMAMMDEQGQGRSYVVNGRPPNTLSGSPPSAAGLEQSMNGVGENSQIDNPRSGNQSFDQSTPSFGTSPAVGARPGGGPLPPPSQPPPPPPAPQMGGHQGGYFQPPPSQMMMMDSLNRRGGSLSGSGLLVGPPPRIRDYSEYGIPTGIPTNNGGGGGCTETPKPGMMMAMNAAPAPSVSNKQAQAQHQQQQAYNGGMVQSTPTSTRYREGQA